MVKYLHIGYPKNFSTSLQRDYFSNNPEIFHLGIGLGDNLGYRDSVVDKAFEVYLKTAKGYSYNKIKGSLTKHFNSLYEKALSDSAYKAFGASSEHISFAFTYDGLSNEVKAQRVAEVMGKDTHIIMIVRNQLDLIKSLYRESVRVGFKGDFDRYIYYLYKYQDRNYVQDLFFDWVLGTYQSIFGKSNVHILFFENYRKRRDVTKNTEGQPLLFSDLDKILQVNSRELTFGHYNEALSDREVIIKSELNMTVSHDLGNHMYEIAEKHRIKTYQIEDLGLLEEEKKLYEDVISKRELVASSKKTAEQLESTRLNYDCDPVLLNKLMTNYYESNTKLEKLLGYDLPQEYKQ